MPNSSGFAAFVNVTFRVLGGKSGNIAARNGNDVARWAAKTAMFGGILARSCCHAGGCDLVRGPVFGVICGC